MSIVTERTFQQKPFLISEEFTKRITQKGEIKLKSSIFPIDELQIYLSLFYLDIQKTTFKIAAFIWKKTSELLMNMKGKKDPRTSFNSSRGLVEKIGFLYHPNIVKNISPYALWTDFLRTFGVKFKESTYPDGTFKILKTKEISYKRTDRLGNITIEIKRGPYLHLIGEKMLTTLLMYQNLSENLKYFIKTEEEDEVKNALVELEEKVKTSKNEKVKKSIELREAIFVKALEVQTAIPAEVVELEEIEVKTRFLQATVAVIKEVYKETSDLYDLTSEDKNELSEIISDLSAIQAQDVPTPPPPPAFQGLSDKTEQVIERSLNFDAELLNKQRQKLVSVNEIARNESKKLSEEEESEKKLKEILSKRRFVIEEEEEEEEETGFFATQEVQKRKEKTREEAVRIDIAEILFEKLRGTQTEESEEQEEEYSSDWETNAGRVKDFDELLLLLEEIESNTDPKELARFLRIAMRAIEYL